jgi:ribonuclease HII
MRIQAGIDEAGLGPLLGPLTIGCTAFRVPTADCNLWRLLRDATSASPLADKRKLVVADSKIGYTRNPRGERRLESTALSFLAMRQPDRRLPHDGAELCTLIGRDLCTTHESLRGEFWHAHLASVIPRSAATEVLAGHGAALANALNASGVELACAGAAIIPASELNASFDRTENKSVTHWQKSAPILRALWDAHAHEGIALTVDRHGGRMRYARLLEELFPDAEVDVQIERPASSEYLLVASGPISDRTRRMRVAFRERADSSSFTTALASCLAKYARELCMHAFNAYFRTLAPDLEPTAGYSTDARRWLGDAELALARSGLSTRMVVRAR